VVQFRVQAPSLSAAAASIGAVIAVFDSNLSGVAQRMSSVVGNTWQGRDADDTLKAWQSFESTAANVRLVLTSLQTRLIAADSTYTQTELTTQRSFTGNRPSILAIRKGAQAYAKIIATGEARAEDMAEFFGRDYAGDDEVEQFGGGAVGRRGGGRNGVAGDSDGDGDSDVKGTGVFLSNESVEALYGEDSGKEAGFVHTDAGVEQVPEASLEGVASESGGDTAPSAGETPAGDGQSSEQPEVAIAFESMPAKEDN